MTTRDITIGNFEETIGSNETVLLDFWAEWCGPCRNFAPVFDKAATEHPEIVFGKVDTEAEQQLAAGFGIQSIPTLMAFRQGVLVFNQPGALNAAQLGQLITAVGDLDMEKVHAEIAAADAEQSPE